jgi:hypothetical protein
MKRCYCCKLEKPLDRFPKNQTRADGHGSMCGWYRMRQQSSAVSSEEEQLTLNQRVGIS